MFKGKFLEYYIFHLAKFEMPSSGNGYICVFLSSVTILEEFIWSFLPNLSLLSLFCTRQLYCFLHAQLELQLREGPDK